MTRYRWSDDRPEEFIPFDPVKYKREKMATARRRLIDEYGPWYGDLISNVNGNPKAILANAITALRGGTNVGERALVERIYLERMSTNEMGQA